LIAEEKPVEIGRRGIKRRMKDRLETTDYETHVDEPPERVKSAPEKEVLITERAETETSVIKESTEKSVKTPDGTTMSLQQKKADKSWKYHSCLGYTLIILGLGFPVWFATTKVDRASLPYDEVASLSEPNMTESVLLISDGSLGLSSKSKTKKTSYLVQC
jgi:hypothetical protein